MIRKIVSAALLSTALLGTAVGGALAQETVVWWDFLGGGDGVRMKALLSEHPEVAEARVLLARMALDSGETQVAANELAQLTPEQQAKEKPSGRVALEEIWIGSGT